MSETVETATGAEGLEMVSTNVIMAGSLGTEGHVAELAVGE